MELKGNYDITESGIYIVIFKDENGEDWEVEFDIWIDKKYNYEETGKQLIGVDIQTKCLSPGFMIVEEVLMEIDVQDHIYNNFSIMAKRTKTDMKYIDYITDGGMWSRSAIYHVLADWAVKSVHRLLKVRT